jgi:hypothetical protein
VSEARPILYPNEIFEIRDLSDCSDLLIPALVRTIATNGKEIEFADLTKKVYFGHSIHMHPKDFLFFYKRVPWGRGDKT